jgi:pimeloyl-ACP methyl ester carboxylesterase
MRLSQGGLTFEVTDEGTGPPVLLHGFPDSSAVCRHQIPSLVSSGYRAIAPDLRSFGKSDRPEGVENYRIELLVVGHCIPLGAPHALNALLLKFLEECHSDKAIPSG